MLREIDRDADIRKINDAWDREGSLTRLGLRPSCDRQIQAALVPPGGDWQCVALEGQPTRSIIWNQTPVALMNPLHFMGSGLEGEVAMGIRATPLMDRALRVISILADDPANAHLIQDIARAAINYVEQPAPQFAQEPDEDDEDYER